MKTCKAIFILFVGLLAPLAALSAAPMPLTLGSTASGSISIPGQMATYTFTGAPGQRLIYDALDNDFDPIQARLISPTGVIVSINGNADYDVAPFTLLEAGSYTLVIDGSGATTGDYSFRLLDLAAQSVLPLDTVLNGTLDPGLSVLAYRLNGTAGQHLYFDGKGVNAGASWYLYGPNNEYLSGAGIGADFEVTLTQAGTYAVVIYGNSVSAVPYSVQVVTFETPTSPLTLGATVTGTISEPGEQDFYTFTGTPGQRLIYDALDNDFDSIQARLISPTGVNVGISVNSDYDVAPFTLLEAGTFTLVIDGSGATTGDYSFRLLDLAAQSLLPLDTVLNGTLDPGLSMLTYRLNGTAGQHLYFDGMGVNAGANWYLYGPNNEYISYAGIGADFEFTLTQAGTYAVVIYGTSVNPVPYSVQVVTFETPRTPLTLGATVTGTISEPGEQDIYTFSGTNGQRVYYDALDRDFENINARLISPTGVVYWEVNHSSDWGPVTLLETGEYKLVLDGSGATVGDYSFRLDDLALAPPISLTAATDGQLDPSSETDIYQFTGTVGQMITLNSISATLQDATWRLVSPANQNLVSGGILANLGTVLLPLTGTYFVFVEGTREGIASLNYRIRLIDVSDTPVAVSGLGDILTGTISPGQKNTNTFTAPAGLLIYFDSQDRSNGSLALDLRDPSNNLILTIATASDYGPYQLPRSGTYTTILRGNDNNSTGSFRFRILDLAGSAPPLALDTTVAADLNPGYKTDVYQFAGVAGQRLFYDALDNDFDSIVVRLWTPNGNYQHLNGNADSDVGVFTLLTSGTFYLFFESNLPTTADYKFRLLDLASQPLAPIDTPITGTLDPGLATAIYRLPGIAGQHLYFDGQATNAGASWYLYGPNNEYVGGAGIGADFEVTLTQTGTHALVIYGNSPNPVPFSVTVINPEGPPGAADQPQITAITTVGNIVTVTWTALPMRTYFLQFKTNLNLGDWTDLPGKVMASEATASKTDNVGTDTQRFYRVKLAP